MSYEAARIAAYDQAMAQIRDLVQMVHDHHQAGICDGRCPGLKVLTDLDKRPHLAWLDLLVAALIRIEELQSDPETAAPHEHTATCLLYGCDRRGSLAGFGSDIIPKPAGRWAWILGRKR